MSGLRIHPLNSRIWSDDRGLGVHPFKAAGLDGKPAGDVHVVSLRPWWLRRGSHQIISEEVL